MLGKSGAGYVAERLSFLGEPSQTNKKQRNLWYRQYRDNWNAFIVEAADVTCLSESALRQYARVVRHGVRVEDLTFSHHIEVQRAHFYDEKGKRRFDSNRATEILELAKKNKWTVAQTRDEVRRRYPTSAVVESAVDKARRMLMEIVSSVSEQDYVTVVDALFTALQEVKERPEYRARRSYADIGRRMRRIILGLSQEPCQYGTEQSGDV